MTIDEKNSAKSIAMRKYFSEHPEAKQARSESMKKLWKDSEYRNNQTKSIQISGQDPELRKYRSERMKKWWEDPEHVEFQSKRQTELANSMWADPIMRETLIKSAKSKWDDPEIHDKYCKASQKRWEDPNEHTKISNTLKKFAEDPLVRKQISERVIKSFKEKNVPERMSKIMKEKFEDPEFKSYSLSKSHSPEALIKLSESLKKGYEEHPEWGERTSKNQKEWMSVPEHSPTWKGGTSFLPY